MSDDLVHIELPVNVPLGRLIETESDFRDLITEVGRAVVRTSNDPVKWIVKKVEQGSVRLEIQARPSGKKVAPSEMPDVVFAITNGVEILEQRPERPPFFTNRALEKARKLASHASHDFPIRIFNGHQEAKTNLTSMLVANVDKIMGSPLRSIGTIEGTLERLNVHEKRTFSIYDRLTGDAVECHFGRRISVEHLAAAMEKRISVHGEIRYSLAGDIISVNVESFEVAPTEELPTAEDVRGLLG